MSVVVTKRTAPRVIIDRPETAKVIVSKRASSGIIVDQNSIETTVGLLIRRGGADINKLESIRNVNALDLQDGYALIYDTTTDKWVAAPNEPNNLDRGNY